MKKFLIYYLFFVFFLLILFVGLKLGLNGLKKEVRQTERVSVKNQRKKIIVITTEEFEPRGRVVCKTANGAIFSGWMSAEEVVHERIEMTELYGSNNNCEIYIQYDKWPY